MKIVHAADLHIDSPLRGLSGLMESRADDLRVAARRAFERLVAHVIAEEAELLLLAGDVFDGDWKDFNTGLFFVRQLGRLRDVGTKVVMVRGNHDAASVISRNVRLPDHVRELSTRRAETVVFEDLGIAVHGQGYATRAVTDNLSAAFPAPLPGLLNIGLLHTNATGSTDHQPYAPCTVGGLADHGYDYWALGHVHQRAVLREGPWVVYPGNLQGRHARETGAKGAYDITIEDGRIEALEFVEHDVARWLNVQVSGSDVRHPDDVLDVVRGRLLEERADAGDRPLVARVEVVGASRAHGPLLAGTDRLRAELEALGGDVGDLWLERLRVRTHPMADARAHSHELLQAVAAEIESLGDDDDVLGSYLDELSDLRRKTSGSLAGFWADAPDNLRSLLPQIEARLLDALHEPER